jgi:hypothetical protein
MLPAMTDDNLPFEYKLLRDATALDLTILDTKIEDFMESTHVKITLEEEPDVLSSCAWGLIYAIGVLSFADARPRGISDMHFVEKDDWYVADMLEHLRFDHGRLHFYADYVRGRCLKTTVDIDKDGKIVVETVNRGEAATRWISKLQGKKVLSLVDDAQGPAAPGA